MDKAKKPQTREPSQHTDSKSVNPEKMEATLAWMKKLHAECVKVPNSKEQLECHSMKKKQ